MSATDSSTPPQGPASLPAPELDVFGHAPKGRLDWAHRKGEPRTFALFWMIYLMGASLLMVASIAAVQSISPGVVRPAARAMILTAALGLTVLWPMVRLSQLPPKGSKLSSIAVDLLVLIPPFAALILPQSIDVLANWPRTVVFAVLIGLAGWAVLLGAVLALALRTLSSSGGDAWHRSLWMILIVTLVLAPVAYHTLTHTPLPTPNPSEALPAPGSALSPISLVTDLLADRSAMGRSAAVGPAHWTIIRLVWAAGLAAWGIGLAAALARPDRQA